MKKTLDMPIVDACEQADCAYNTRGNCHAQAITVGDGNHPACDTCLPASHHTRHVLRIAGVGACKVVSCSHNDDYACQANAIRMTKHGQHADCATFSLR